MKLKFIKPHKSIVKLNDIEINDFAIVTGLNGTGKTHLLHAIEEGSIAIEGIQSSEIITIVILILTTIIHQIQQEEKIKPLLLKKMRVKMEVVLSKG